MRHRDFPESITIIKHNVMESSNRSSSATGSDSSSSRRPEDFYYDIKFDPQPERRILSSSQNKVVRNRLRAFEIASRALRDVSDCVEDHEDALVMIESDFQPLRVDQNQGSSDKASSYHGREKRYSTELLDFGNNSDSRVHQIRRQDLRQTPGFVTGPTREWGDLTYHNSSTEFTFAPRSPPRYRPSMKY